nr:low molecular weight protein-tyrosine-phosphatase [uncultured Rhodoferax sp.]
MKPYSILFVCMGNICRSPTAHGVFRHMVKEQGLDHVIHVDSAGTHNYHPGSPPDERSQEHAAKRGYQLADLRARQIAATDFDQHDLILVMDWDNLALVQDICPASAQKKVRRLAEFCLASDCTVIPDPYYGGADGFDQVLDLVEDAAEGLLRYVKQLGRLPLLM